VNVTLDNFMKPYTEAACELDVQLMLDDVSKPIAECSFQYGKALLSEIRFVHDKHSNY